MSLVGCKQGARQLNDANENLLHFSIIVPLVVVVIFARQNGAEACKHTSYNYNVCMYFFVLYFSLCPTSQNRFVLLDDLRIMNDLHTYVTQFGFILSYPYKEFIVKTQCFLRVSFL